MKFPISLGKIEIKYFLMTGLAIGFLISGRNSYSLLYSKKKEDIYGKDIKIENRLLKSFLKYIGFSLFIIGDLIIQKISFKNDKEEDKIKYQAILSKSYNITKEDSKYLFTLKDILFIFLISLAHLVGEFLAIMIKTLTDLPTITLDEQYISVEFIFFFFTSLMIFKLNYYKHQYYSIVILIILELFRFIMKECVHHEEDWKKFIIQFFLKIIKAFIDSLFIGYSKGLMEYKYFSPYKALYIFGFINGAIMLIIYIIVSYKPVDEGGSFCSLIYNGKCYFDNFRFIFQKFSFVQFCGLFLDMISVAGGQLIFNIIINDYTICHLFTYYYIYSFIFIFEENNPYVISFSIISFILEILIIFVFLELLILNFCGLNKNVKINIQKRAISESNLLYTGEKGSFDINDDYAIEVDEKKNSLEPTPLLPLNENKEDED